ncbi:MAG: GntR family transcriptional regulator, partial [Gammaproteobacteria bacterium]|nr:GntR family transcriptional regulator [Gammaproteobacteria bacterium]
LTVLKGYQERVDDDLVEKKRGLGMFVPAGARSKLLKNERQRFLDQEWPLVVASIERLGLSMEDLLNKAGKKKAKAKSGDKES